MRKPPLSDVIYKRAVGMLPTDCSCIVCREPEALQGSIRNDSQSKGVRVLTNFVETRSDQKEGVTL